MTKEIIVQVRWIDGYLETFECTDYVRASASFLSMRLTIGENRNIPMCNVRWYSRLPESHSK
jgi:hypothetical protein